MNFPRFFKIHYRFFQKITTIFLIKIFKMRYRIFQKIMNFYLTFQKTLHKFCFSAHQKWATNVFKKIKKITKHTVFLECITGFFYSYQIYSIALLNFSFALNKGILKIWKFMGAKPDFRSVKINFQHIRGGLDIILNPAKIVCSNQPKWPIIKKLNST